MEFQQSQAIIEAVAASSLIGCVSGLTARDALALGRVVQLASPDLDLRRRFYILSHREKYMTLGIRAFLKILRRHDGELPALIDPRGELD